MIRMQTVIFWIIFGNVLKENVIKENVRKENQSFVKLMYPAQNCMGDKKFWVSTDDKQSFQPVHLICGNCIENERIRMI